MRLTETRVLAAQRLADLARTGATVSLATGAFPTAGYVVGRDSLGTTFQPTSRDDTLAAILSWLESLPERRNAQGKPRAILHAGIWHDSETGITHLDAVDVYVRRSSAETIARRNRQPVIQALHSGRMIRVAPRDRQPVYAVTFTNPKPGVDMTHDVSCPCRDCLA